MSEKLQTPLLLAVAQKPPDRVEIERLLQLPDPQINALNSEGYTALMVLAEGDEDEYAIAELLLKHGADPSIQSDGNTALIVATRNAHRRIIEVLLPKSDVNHANNIGETALMEAASIRHHTIMKLLLDHGADPNLTNVDKQTVLHRAAQDSYTEIVDLLLERGANPNPQDERGQTPLMLVIDRADTSSFEEQETTILSLLKHGADPNLKNAETYTPFYLAIKKFSNASGISENTLVDLLEHGANPNYVPRLGYYSYDYKSPLILAIEANYPPIVKALLKHGADPNHVDENGQFPLFHTVYIHDVNIEIVHDLLAQPTLDVNFHTNKTESALVFAVSSGEETLSSLFLERGADPNSRSVGGDTVLMIALAKDQIELAEALLKKGADPNLFVGNGYTAIFKAQTMEGIELLLKHGVDPNSRNIHTQETVLIYYTRSGSPNVIKLLLEKGADPNLTDKDGMTAVYHSVDSFNIHPDTITVLNLLLDSHANPNVAVPSDGDTPLIRACRTHDQTLIEALLTHGADPNLSTLKGNTAFHSTILTCMNNPSHDDTPIFKLLKQHGADVNRVNTKGQTVLMLAAETNILEYVQELLYLGADKTLKDRAGKAAVDYTADENIQELLSSGAVKESLWNGFTRGDVEGFNGLFASPEKLLNISICPFCLQYTERDEGCKIQTHTCDPQLRHRRLFNLYATRNTRAVQWCSICGRPAVAHLHCPATDGTETKIPELLDAGRLSVMTITDEACIAAGGGGTNEKLRRIQTMIRALCDAQSRVGVGTERAEREAIILAAWKAGFGEDSVQSQKNRAAFNIPCDLPTELPTVAAAAVSNIPTVNPPPIRREGMECSVNLNVPASGFVYEFPHTQPDGTVYTHPERFCVDDLMETLRSVPESEIRVCPLDNGEHCKGKIYPADVVEILGKESPEYQGYRERFNRAAAAAAAAVGGRRRKTRKQHKQRKQRKLRGGVKDGRPFFTKMMNATYAVPPRNGGRYKKTRKQKRALSTKKQRRTRH